MNKVNFNAFKDIKASGELIGRTIAAAGAKGTAPEPIPAKQAAVHRLSTARRLSIAAALVLAVGVGITLYFYVRNINSDPIPVAPVPTSDSSTENASAVPTGGASEPAYVPTAPTQAGAAAPTQSGAVKPTEPPSEAATVSGTSVPAQPPAVKATEKPIVRPTVIPTGSPAEKPTAPPTRPDTQAATQAATEVTVIISDPTELEVLDPWEQSHPVIIRGWLTEELRLNAKVVYCRIESCDGTPIGDSDLYSNEHKAAVIRAYRYVDYDPVAKGVELDPGDWYCYFYDADGNVFCEGQVHVG